MAKVMGNLAFFVMEDLVDPLSSLSGMVDGISETESLFCNANVLSMKQWEEPESNKALKGQRGLEISGEERERRNEPGEREEALS